MPSLSVCRRKCFFFIHLGVEGRYEEEDRHRGTGPGKTVAEGLPVAASCLTSRVGAGGRGPGEGALAVTEEEAASCPIVQCYSEILFRVF